MRKTPRIVSLATALAALGVPAAAVPTADAENLDGGQFAPEAGSGTQVETEIRLMEDGELMSFTVHRISDGLMFPQHGSHSSHSSHASHASSSPGGGGSYWPNPSYSPPVYAPPVYAPPVYAPPPVVPPPVVPPPESTTSPAPVPASDPRPLACRRASNGYGMNEIASELQQAFGMPENEAVNMARQALTAVLAGGHYCDGYLGDHQ
jgi:hypothetical protein